MQIDEFSSEKKCNELISTFENEKTNIAKDELKEFFIKTNVFEFIDKISLVFCDSLEKDLLLVMIEKLDKIRNSKHISTVVYACSEYDCSDFLFFFVKLFTELDDSVTSQIIGIIEDMAGPIDKCQKIESIMLLNNVSMTLDINSERFAEMNYVIQLIESLEN